MPDADRVHSRREPIEVIVEGIDGKPHTFVAKPLGWRRRNDLGKAIVESYSKTLNESIFEVVKDPETGNDRYNFHFAEATIDYDGILAVGFPDNTKGDFDDLTFEDLVDKVLEAALAVNGLERQRHMLDLGKAPVAPESPPPDGDDGEKTESSPD